MSMFESKKYVFWQAFLFSVLIFGIGLLFGVFLEQSRISYVNTLFASSEISLLDVSAQSALLDGKFIPCEDASKAILDLADRVFSEAQLLEKYGRANKINDELKLAHRRYDLLRTILWIQTINLQDRCILPNRVVYLYKYETDDIELKAKQVVWSRILLDLKEKNGGRIVLIPIAVDTNVSSLNILLRYYYINKFPAVIVNEEIVLDELTDVEKLESYLNSGNSTSKTTPR